jgi:hypothetical protein
MSWIKRLTHATSRHGARARSGTKSNGSGIFVEIADLTTFVCELARESAPLASTLVEEEVAKLAAGLVNANSYTQAMAISEQAFEEASKAALTREEQAALDAIAVQLLEQIDGLADSERVGRAREDEAEAAVDEQRELLSARPLIEKVRTTWPLAIVAVIATSAGAGTLAHLSLEGVSDEAVRLAITIAAAGGAVATELVLGSFGAETYDRLPEERRRRALLVLSGLLVAVLVGTEVMAAIARQAGVDLTNSFTIDPATGQPSSAGTLTPSLYWTAPLGVLVTLAGSGMVGVARLREASQPVHDALTSATQRYADARATRKETEAAVEKLREKAKASQQTAARLRGKSEAASANSERLLATMDQQAKRHGEIVTAVTARAILEYRIAAAELERGEVERAPAAGPSAGRVSTALSAAGLAGLASGLATASLGLGAAVASAVFLFVGVVRAS